MWLTELRKALYLKMLFSYQCSKWAVRWRAVCDKDRKGPEHRNFHRCVVRMCHCWSVFSTQEAELTTLSSGADSGHDWINHWPVDWTLQLPPLPELGLVQNLKSVIKWLVFLVTGPPAELQRDFYPKKFRETTVVSDDDSSYKYLLSSGGRDKQRLFRQVM